MITEMESLHGWQAPMSTPVERRAAVDAAFDYRGDVTLTLGDGRTLTGFVSNRDFDAAAGKSWDLWLKKVAEAEAQGKIAELYPDEH